MTSVPEDLLLLLTTGIKKTVVWKTTFVSEHLDKVHQSQSKICFALVACFACFSLGDSIVRANHAKSAKNIVDFGA